jgi:predicted transposase YbfD/YdcC
LDELLLTAISAILSVADTWVSVALWGRAKLDWLRQFLPFANGIVAHDTFGRVFSLLDATVFEACFRRWMRTVCGAFEGLQVAIDGTTVRRAKSAGQSAIPRVSAFAQGLGLTLGQVKTAEKSNEITAIPELLDALLLKGCLVTIDAMGCQKAIAAKLIQQESDYLLMVKNNQPNLAAAIEHCFDTARATGYQHLAHTMAEWIEKDHGRIETRRCVVTPDLSGLGALGKDWPGLQALVMIEARREVQDEVSTERRYYLSSRLADAAENFSVLRRIALNLFRQDHAVKAGVKTRRLLASADDVYRQKMLGLQAVA